jgi:hypothetical protein
MKLKISAILATLAIFNLSLSAQAKKKAPAKPAAPVVAAPAKPAAPVAAMPAAPAAAEEAAEPVEGFFVKKVKGPGDGKEITLKLGGYVDAYYAYHTRGDGDFRPGATHPAGTADATSANIGNSPATGTTGRVFESPGQQFSLGLVQTKFEMGNEDWQVVADLIHGPNAEQTNFNNVRGASSSTTSTAIKQAYVSGKLFKGLKLTAGQWSTHVGYEVVESYQNANYTLNYLFGYGPFYHTGAKLDYEVSDKISVMAGVVNGWDLQYDNNKDKSAIAQIALKPTSSFNIFLNYVGGNETTGRPGSTTDNNVGGMRHIGDLVMTYQVSKMLKLGLNVVYGENKVNTATPAAKWGGAAAYVSLTPVDGFTLSYRAEYYDDRQQARGLLGVTGGTSNGADVMGHTLTGTISMYGGHFLIRPEVKYDVSNKEVFGVGGSELKKDNITALVAVTGVY